MRQQRQIKPKETKPKFKSTVQQKNRESTGEALLRLAKLGEKLQVKAQPDLSSRIDDILYGDE